MRGRSRLSRQSEFCRQVDNARPDLFEARERPLLLNGRPLHGKGIASALEMVMAQDAAAHDGQVGIGTH